MADPIPLPSYLTVDQADAIAPQLYGMLAYLGATETVKLQALTAASQRVDASRRWQGRKVDELQPLEFPRIDGCKLIVADVDGVTPAVPINLKIATVYEADSLIKGQRQRILEAQQSGLQSQQIGSAIEAYFAPVNARGVPLLCVEADARLIQYRLRSGGLS